MTSSSHPIDVVIIDDDEISNRLCQTMIMQTIAHLALENISIHIFTDTIRAIGHIRHLLGTPDNSEVILFLDIRMPIMNGWDVLDDLATLPQEQARKMTIYLLTTSFSAEDRTRALQNPLVSRYFNKPMRMTDWEKVLTQIH
jgi:CheY-like chemotaxis protein